MLLLFSRGGAFFNKKEELEKMAAKTKAPAKKKAAKKAPKAKTGKVTKKAGPKKKKAAKKKALKMKIVDHIGKLQVVKFYSPRGKSKNQHFKLSDELELIVKPKKGETSKKITKQTAIRKLKKVLFSSVKTADKKKSA